MEQVTNMTGKTFKVGGRVRHNDGWHGTVTKIRSTNGYIRVHVEPDAPDLVPGRIPLAYPTRDGRRDFIEARDHGLSMGNFTPCK